MEPLAQPLAEPVGDAESRLQRRRMAPLLDGGDGLAREAHAPAQLGPWVMSCAKNAEPSAPRGSALQWARLGVLRQPIKIGT